MPHRHHRFAFFSMPARFEKRASPRCCRSCRQQIYCAFSYADDDVRRCVADADVTHASVASLTFALTSLPRLSPPRRFCPLPDTEDSRPPFAILT